jgi:hypothetical protein
MGEIKELFTHVLVLFQRVSFLWSHLAFMVIMDRIFCFEELDKFGTILTMCNRKFGMPTYLACNCEMS